jgi:hypothetical protein
MQISTPFNSITLSDDECFPNRRNYIYLTRLLPIDIQAVLKVALPRV